MSSENTKENSLLPDSATVEIPDSAEKSQSKDGKFSSQRRRWISLPTAVGALMLTGVGWVGVTRVIMPLILFGRQQAPPPTPVPLSQPELTTIENSSDYAASLDSRQSITLQPRVAGQVIAIYVQSGSRVQAGERLLQIDANEQQAQLSSRKAAVEAAQAEIEAAQAEVANAQDIRKSLQARKDAVMSNVKLAQWEYQRYQELVKKGAISQQVLVQKRNAWQTTRAELAQVEADIKAQNSAIAQAKAQVMRNTRAMDQSKADVSEGKAQLQYYTITAPFSGMIGDIPIKEGDFVDNATPLLNLTQNQELEIEIPIPLEKASALRPGLQVKLLGDQGRVLKTGQVSFVAPNVNPATQSIQTKAKFTNFTERLRSAQFVQARVVWSTRPGLLVPTTAISRLGGKDFIFVAAPFKDSGCQNNAQGPQASPSSPPPPDQLVATQKLVKLGKIVGNNQEIVEGLSRQDRIVTSGILQLQNCTSIAEL
jgi:multidrug efflux pump subunit AcrA (membrane-fusion protein)